MLTNIEATKHAMAEVMDFSINRGEWDEHPMLFVIKRESNGEHRTVLLHIPLDVWAHYGHAVTVMEILSLGYTMPGAPTPPFIGVSEGDDVVALVCFTESWTISVEAGVDAMAELSAWMDAGHTISDHPNRIEAKSITAITVEDETAMLNYNRGAEAPVPVTGVTLEGRVIDGMRQLLAALRQHFSN